MHINAVTGPVNPFVDDSQQRRKVLFLNRSYWPDAEATGQLLTELCEDLAPSLDVTVIAGQPNDNPTGAAYRRHGTEMHDGVRVRRVRHTRFPKRFLPGRIVNYLSFLLGALWAALWVKRPDVVVVETDPPLLCLIGRYLQRVRGAKLVIYLQDIHPDIAVAIGKVRDGRLVRALRRLMFHVYRGADRVVVLSRDMRDRVVESGVAPERVVCVPNWIDTALVQPIKRNNPFREEHCLNGEFVVMYSGNLGLCQRLEDVVAAAGYLRHRKDILILLVGEGALKRQLEDQVVQLGLPNVRFLPYQPKSDLASSLSAADVHLVPLDPRVASCLMPSKLYGVLASGTPLVAVAPDECELADLTREHGVGVVAPPGEPEALADILARLADETWDLGEMGLRARRLAEAKYDRKAVTARFHALLSEVLGAKPAELLEPVAAPAARSRNRPPVPNP
jgi:glycosyltransferase involved in cell wall biosynthesis